MSKRLDCMERLRGFASLEPGWDGEGGAAIDPDVIRIAERFLSDIYVPGLVEKYLSVVPTSRGGVQIEFHSEYGDAEVEIDPDGWIREERRSTWKGACSDAEAALSREREAAERWEDPIPWEEAKESLRD